MRKVNERYQFTTLIVITVLLFPFKHGLFTERLYSKSMLITDDTYSWYASSLLDFPALYYELEITVIFPKEKCCPVMYLPTQLPSFYNISQTDWCYPEVLKQANEYWFKTTTFFLPDNTQKLGECLSNSTHYSCMLRTKDLNFEPRLSWLTFAYTCGDTKSLAGLQYAYTAWMKNETQCERMKIPQDKKDFYFQCDKFYKYVTFPNIFGHTSQSEAFIFLQLFDITFINLEQPCYQHLDFFLCQALLPRCPERSNSSAVSISNQNYSVSHIVTSCEDMCVDAFNACNDVFLPIISFFNCRYYNQITYTNRTCIYHQVNCGQPPEIENGNFIDDGNTTYQAGSRVQYNCEKQAKMMGNKTSKCAFTGSWTSPPTCKNKISYQIPIIVSCIVCVIIGIIIACVIHKYRRKRMDVGNVSLQKRNKQHDAFVSYYSSSDSDDSYFVRHELHPKLELDTEPSFKLLMHERDFRADTLIYVNIMEAIKESNSAIIVLSQNYIDSDWCKEEFQECMEENKKDPAYKLYVIMMQPEETLERYTAYMDKYFRTKTYLNKDDPKLWTKLTKYLSELRTEMEESRSTTVEEEEPV